MRTRPLLLTLTLTAAFALAPTTPTHSESDGDRIRWDIVSINFASGTVSPGGHATAFANDGSSLKLTGKGTFGSDSDDDDVTGGGNWTSFSPSGAVTGSGTYKVRALTRFWLAPGTFPGLKDTIGDKEDGRAGLLKVEIRFSDKAKGTLTVSCHFVGTPDSVFEGITVSKGFVDYWNRQAPPAPPGDANRTAFHVLDDD